MRNLTDTPFHSTRLGNLPKGCRLCVKGEKTVLFITGVCPRKCFYCPISDQKSKKDVTYANEWPTANIKDIIKETTLCKSKGAGFTGGDPLSKLPRTLKYIRALKKHFGRQFHIHLYTSLNLITEQTLSKLYSAGLDEIRIHPDIDDSKLWKKIDLVKHFRWDYGVEIPAIPGKRAPTKALLFYLNDKVKFVNINELEVSDAKASKVTELGYRTKTQDSYGIKGSEEMAKDLLNYIRDNNFSYAAHFCTAKLKDRIQLTNRILRRAKSVKQKFDIITDDGTLLRGALYGKDLPKKLKLIKKQIDSNFLLENNRILTSAPVAEEFTDFFKSLKLKPAIVEEYPTWDKLIVELEWL